MNPCCDNPENFVLDQSIYDTERETGYVHDLRFYRCQECGNLICDEDLAAICQYRELMNRQQAEPDAVPVEIDEATRIRKQKVA